MIEGVKAGELESLQYDLQLHFLQTTPPFRSVFPRTLSLASNSNNRRRKLSKWFNVGDLYFQARLRGSSYVAEWDLYITITARSCIRSNFLLSDDLQKCQVRWQ